MPISLEILITRLQSDVPARSGVPDSGQYEQAVRDAVGDFNQRAPMQKVAVLSVVSGAAAYSLPADFVRVISLQSLTEPGSVIVSGSGLIPTSAAFRERYTIAGLTITFYPTPTYTLARELWYAAGHVLDIDDAYPNMTPDVASSVILKAQAIALMLQANKAAQEAWSYQIGDERVSKEKLAAELRAQAQAAEARYLQKAASGGAGASTIGLRADYRPDEYGSFG